MASWSNPLKLRCIFVIRRGDMVVVLDARVVPLEHILIRLEDDISDDTEIREDDATRHLRLGRD